MDTNILNKGKWDQNNLPKYVCKVKTLYTSKGKQHIYTENNVLVVNLYVPVVVDLLIMENEIKNWIYGHEHLK
jgi:hypothetical protein